MRYRLPRRTQCALRTVIVAPMTTSGRAYPWRIRCRFQRRSGYVVLDQLRTVDRERLVKRLGTLPTATMVAVLSVLQEMFAEWTRRRFASRPRLARLQPPGGMESKSVDRLVALCECVLWTRVPCRTV